MKQCFRLMGIPDKVIAFDALPERLLKGFEMCRAEGFPRHWKEWLGKKKVTIPIPPEKDFLTGQVRRFDPIIDEDCFFYMVDYSLNQSVEKWKEICDFVRQHVSKDIRLKEKLDDMALPLAPNKTDGVTLEPEEVVVIPIPLEFQEKAASLVNANGAEIKKEAEKKKSISVSCDEPGCKFESEGAYAKNALRMHKVKRHPIEVTV